LPESADSRERQARRIASELDDALYYLRRGCGPCAERHFDLARQHGASEEQVKAVLAVANSPAAPAR
jgi:alkylhydroperoxidase family enzyme